jgi:hypothetical protein
MIRRSLNPVLLTALAVMSLGVGQQPGPPNDLWPVRRLVDVRAGCHVLVVASWGRAGKPRVRPLEAFDPLWDELCSWLTQCPTLTDIETFWVFDGRGWSLLVTGVELAAEPEITTVRIPTGTIAYDEAPFARRDVPDNGYVDVRVELSPEDVAKIQRERETLSAGYEVRQQPLHVNYVSRMPDDSLEIRELPQTWDEIEALRSQRADSELASEPEDMSGFDDAIERLHGIAPIGGRFVAAGPCEVRNASFSVGGAYADGDYTYSINATIAPRIYRVRDQQRENRKRRAARKRKRGWA